jgi:hypothetical protein
MSDEVLIGHVGGTSLTKDMHIVGPPCAFSDHYEAVARRMVTAFNHRMPRPIGGSVCPGLDLSIPPLAGHLL